MKSIQENEGNKKIFLNILNSLGTGIKDINSKFEKISSVTFADIKEAKIITTNLDNNIYRQETEILEVRK